MSYARSPRPLCSITIGIRPSPLGSSMRVFFPCECEAVRAGVRFPLSPVPRQGQFGTSVCDRQAPSGRRTCRTARASLIDDERQRQAAPRCPITCSNVAGSSVTRARAMIQSTTFCSSTMASKSRRRSGFS